MREREAGEKREESESREYERISSGGNDRKLHWEKTREKQGKG